MDVKFFSKRAAGLCLGVALAITPAIAADAPAGTATGKSEMSVGFTPPEKPKPGPRPWTPAEIQDADRLQHRHDSQLPRCEQDRLLTDTRPCRASSR